MIYYKVLHPKGKPHMGTGVWPLPTKSRPGKWLKVEGEIQPCRNGLHACTLEQLPSFVNYGSEFYELEYQGKIVDTGNKVVGNKARLLKHIGSISQEKLILWACDCAERALKRERKAGREPDVRSWNAIMVARKYVKGKATKEEIYVAAYAAYAAVAYGDAALRSLRAAVDAAAYGDAYAVAYAASTLEKQERKWQSERLLKYLEGK